MRDNNVPLANVYEVPPDADLLRLAVQCAPTGRVRCLTRARYVRDAFHIDDFAAAVLCRRFGYDPNEVLP